MAKKLFLFLLIFSNNIFGNNTNSEMIFTTPVITSLTSNSPVCIGNNAIFYITGSPNADVEYNINGGVIFAIVLDTNGNGIITITNPTVNQTLNLLGIHLGTDYTPLTNTITAFINPLPTPTLANGSITVEQSSGTVITPYILDSNLNNTNYTFEWYFNNTLITGANDNTYTANQAGDYYVIATNLYTSCIGTSNTISVTETPLSSDYFSQDQISLLYPNPAYEYMELTSKDLINSIAVYNYLGQKIIFKELNAVNHYTIDLSMLSAGNYLLEINSEEKKSFQKFIKK
ncbi:T9SS type A sorting domain-containing protein [Flavobacterium sp. NRK F10]|uniref:T9SS type A sorting domain-containing protein n=1 Tax=Flavobacterium sp. NRK F10 TaxID=2954931 RepID=UPI0020900361|nr:T9SS type A sorting domain-containing protein [Flavobacterium sp. NRK F10]MCO6175615.1 T9SS type A sorting domain-containing protein [Flavobacterium sp. NRK F10]